MFGNLGFGELMIILVIVLVLFGAKRIPEISASFGKGIREFKKNVNDVERSIKINLDNDISVTFPVGESGITSTSSGVQLLQLLVGGPVVERPLDLRVVELALRRDQGPSYVGLHERSVSVEVQRPDHGRPELVGQQAGSAFSEDRRVQGHAQVREVRRLAARMRLRVESRPRSHERRNIGDRVVHREPGPVPFQVHGLIEVEAARRVDRQERQRREVLVRKPRRLGRLLRLGEDVRGEGARHVQLGAEVVPGDDLRQTYAELRHRLTLVKDVAKP